MSKGGRKGRISNELVAASCAAILTVYAAGNVRTRDQSRHGDIEAWMTIKEGRIVDAGIINCETSYPCSVIDDILHQPVDLQRPDVDKVSRATVSAKAYYYGLVDALKKAETAPTVTAPSP